MQSLLSRMALVLGAALLAGAANAASSAYPDRPVRVIVPFSAGGASDIMGRLLAQKLSERWGQQAYVENRPGAGGNIGMDIAARAAPDGSTIVLMNNAAASNAVLDPRPPFDVTRDFIPIALVASTPMVLVAHPSVPASNLDELTEVLKRNPGKYTYASCGAGGPQNFSIELYKYRAQVQIVHAPYRGCSEAAVGVMSGQVQLAALSSSVALPQVKAGKIKAIATTIGRRMPTAPEIPAFKESRVAALKDYEFDIWYGVMVPAKTPDSVVRKLREDIEAVLDRPEVKQSMAGASIDELRGGGDELARMLKADIAKAQIVVDNMGANPK